MMRKFITALIVLSLVASLSACTAQYDQDSPLEDSDTGETETVTSVDVDPPTTITPIGKTQAITPEWLQLENGTCIARDTETGMLYAGNEAGEYAPYLPDLAVVSNPEELGLPATIIPIGETQAITPEWLQLENGACIARDTKTGMLYAGNEAGEYAPYLPDLAQCLRI